MKTAEQDNNAFNVLTAVRKTVSVRQISKT